jgi:predicted RNA-binding protein YlxR (DUF448 family)
VNAGAAAADGAAGAEHGVDSPLVGGPALSPSRAPRRTCVGCRTRADRSELVRVVAVDGVGVPDPAARLDGRGAWLHPDPSCLDLAERRRALPRALRVPAPLDLTAVRAWFATRDDSTPSTTAPPVRATRPDAVPSKALE